MAAQLAPANLPVIGAPPSLEWVPLDRLNIDSGYQRNVDNPPSAKLIAQIGRNWDWRLFQPLSVARRADGSLFVVDGQHRLAGARLRGDLPHLPCVVQVYPAPNEEAQIFDGLNRNRKKMNYLDTYRAAVGAGVETFARVEAVIKAAGLSVAPHSNWTTWKPLQIACVAGVAKAIRNHGKAATGNALVALAEAWPTEKLRYAGTVAAGLYGVYADLPAGFDPDVFIDVLSEGDQFSWVEVATTTAQKYGWQRPAAMTWTMLQAYNAAAGDRLK